MRRPAKIGPVLAPLAATTAAWALATAATLIAIPRYGLPAPVAAAIAFVLAIGWLLTAATVLRRRVGRPLDALHDEVHRLASTPAGERAAPPALPASPLVAPLGEPVTALREVAEKSAREIRLAMRTGAGREESLRRRLESVIRQLSEGVVVCDGDARILLFNPAAARILRTSNRLTLGASLFDNLARGPAEHALALLERRDDTAVDAAGHAQVICPAVGQPVLLRCRFSRIPDPDSDRRDGFVVAFADATGELESARQRDDLIRSILEDFRAPLANLRAAAENLVSYEDMTPADRASFETLIADESASLSTRLDTWAADSRLLSTEGAMVDITTTDLVAQIAERLTASGPRLTQTGAPLWLRIDSHSVSILFARLLHELARQTGSEEFDIEPLLGDRGVYLDLVWEGSPVPAPEVDHWTLEALEDAVGAPTVRDVLVRHRSDVWSQAHRQPGFALLRLPLPVSPRQWRNPDEHLPGRPEFYDFEMAATATRPELAAIPLADLVCVAFDTETTGLDPDGDDEILAIGAVRLEGARLKAEDTFSELVKPTRPIPAESTRYHGITDKQVRYKPPLEVVLPRFAEFVGDASVLVAHNAAFDMHFLSAARQRTDTRFDNPVLDILLLSVFLDPSEDKQTPGAIAGRLGLTTTARRDVLDDALLAARIYAALVPALDAAGVHTLGDALDAMEQAMSQRRDRIGTASGAADLADSRP